MTYLVLKSLHIVSMVAWFAGLFYLVRLFVYHAEAFAKAPEESAILVKQYHIMEDRLFRIIVRPAMGLTWVFGLLLIYSRGWDWFKVSPWMHLKILLVLFLSGYSERNKKIINQLAEGVKVMSAYQFRLYNEVPTLFLVAIVLLAVIKSLLNFGYTFIGLIVLALALYLGTKWYRRIRTKNNN